MLIGTEKAAEILGYASSYMRQLCGDKIIRDKLKAQKVGRDWLFDNDHIEFLAEEKRAGRIRSFKSF